MIRFYNKNHNFLFEIKFELFKNLKECLLWVKALYNHFSRKDVQNDHAGKWCPK